MAPLELLRRLTARATGTFLGRLKTANSSPPIRSIWRDALADWLAARISRLLVG